MAEDLTQIIENVKTELGSPTYSLKADTEKKLQGDAAKAYLAGYEVGYKDGVKGVTADPVKDGMKVEQLRLTLPWWP